ncbi:hypothetical protein [Actinoplanes lobatus]|uniref:Uncharacterized protein n=1 Tax=Actinoplanes lobatus TaxID=113568 RepID=A0A7W7HRF2_9ACTN|nr:hypothetical protein [Actinoplanes lobatus]MBB4755330.1 hypothetical protein [Actinoplanes lobatus]GIE46388.1 hypothetical protein Alo02nite_92860 [Actinoplanes lobatus]
MSRPMKIEGLALLVAVDCDRGCQVELDLDEASSKTAIGTLADRARIVHDEAHAAEPQHLYRYSDVALVHAHLGGGR